MHHLTGKRSNPDKFFKNKMNDGNTTVLLSDASMLFYSLLCLALIKYINSSSVPGGTRKKMFF